MPVNKFGETMSDNADYQSSDTATPSMSYAQITTQLNNTFLRVDGTNKAIGNLDLDSHKIINVAIPAVETDAATKSYVDSNILNFSDQLSDIMASVSYASVAMRSTT